MPHHYNHLKITIAASLREKTSSYWRFLRNKKPMSSSGAFTPGRSKAEIRLLFYRILQGLRIFTWANKYPKYA
jgi:hypothetical protein